MNALSLNNLWSYLQGLTLTTSNKKWLADHLYAAVRAESEAAKAEDKSSVASILTEEELPEIVRSLSGVISTLDEDDLNGHNAYYEHLAQKYS